MIEDFIKDLKKVSQPRKISVTNSYGVKDAFRAIRKSKWANIGQPVTEHQFYAIIRKINDKLAKNLTNSQEVKFPYKMGHLIIRKYPRKVWLKDGQLKTNLPVDWQATLKLWYEDEEARENKTLIRGSMHEIFKIHYDKGPSDYINSWYYEFRANRNLKVTIAKKASQGVLDAFLFRKYD